MAWYIRTAAAQAMAGASPKYMGGFWRWDGIKATNYDNVATRQVGYFPYLPWHSARENLVNQ
jgi:hypothetical protein